MNKWAKARDDKKPFKPSKASIEKYEVGKDISVDMDDEDLKAVCKDTERKVN